MMDWHDAATRARFEVQPFIDGRAQDSLGQEVFAHLNPATEAVLYETGTGDARDVDRAVVSARSAFDKGGWSRLAPGQRVEALVRLAELIAANRDRLALLDSLEMGKPVSAAQADVAQHSVHLLRSWAGYADKILGRSAPLATGVLSFSVYEPRGVVGAITPWNFPTLNAVYKLGPALAAGNSLVLKPSELAPSSALVLARLALEAGIPEGVFNVVPGLGRTVGQALAAHPGIDFMSFTGSTATGRAIMELCARSNAKPLMLECGGKSAQIVFADVEDLDAVADAVVQSFLWNQGQVCSAHTRLVVDNAIRPQLVGMLVKRAATVRPGDPLDAATDFGPLASQGQRARVAGFIGDGIAAGAQPVLHGEIRDSGGCFVSPTIFDNVTPDMSIAREEIFGPVLCVLGFDTEEEAITLANHTDYGLAATLWTSHLGRAKRMAARLRAGAIFIRTSGAEGADPGGDLGCEPRGTSGFGMERGLEGLKAYSTLKWVNINGA